MEITDSIALAPIDLTAHMLRSLQVKMVGPQSSFRHSVSAGLGCKETPIPLSDSSHARCRVEQFTATNSFR